MHFTLTAISSDTFAHLDDALKMKDVQLTPRGTIMLSNGCERPIEDGLYHLHADTDVDTNAEFYMAAHHKKACIDPQPEEALKLLDEMRPAMNYQLIASQAAKDAIMALSDSIVERADTQKKPRTAPHIAAVL